MAIVGLTGASGFVGRHVLFSLRARGHRVRALVRDPARLPFAPEAADLVRGDLTDRDALSRLATGADAVVHLVGIIAETRGATFHQVHVEGARDVAEAARAAGARRVVHMSAIGARAGPDATGYHQSKAAGEAAVRSAGAPAVILRPTLIVGPESVPINLLARLHRLLPAVPMFGAGDFPMQPIWIGDVALAFALAAEGAVPEGTYELGGPDRVTYAAFVRAIGRAVGHPRPLVRVSLGLARIAAAGFDMLPAGLAPVTSDQLRMLVEGSTTSDNAIERVFGIRPVGVEEALHRAVITEQGAQSTEH